MAKLGYISNHCFHCQTFESGSEGMAPMLSLMRDTSARHAWYCDCHLASGAAECTDPASPSEKALAKQGDWRYSISRYPGPAAERSKCFLLPRKFKQNARLPSSRWVSEATSSPLGNDDCRAIIPRSLQFFLVRGSRAGINNGVCRDG